MTRVEVAAALHPNVEQGLNFEMESLRQIDHFISGNISATR